MWRAVLAAMGVLTAALVPHAAFAAMPPLNIEMHGGTLARSDVERALSTFFKHCQFLNQYQDDLVLMRALVKPEYIPERLQRGWKTEIHITLKISDRPKKMPSWVRGVGRAAGQLLYFNIGGGQAPGIAAAKRLAQHVCGLPLNRRGADSFRLVPELSFLAY